MDDQHKTGSDSGYDTGEEVPSAGGSDAALERGDAPDANDGGDTISGVVTPEDRPEPVPGEGAPDESGNAGMPVFDPRPDLRGA